MRALPASVPMADGTNVTQTQTDDTLPHDPHLSSLHLTPHHRRIAHCVGLVSEVFYSCAGKVSGSLIIGQTDR